MVWVVTVTGLRRKSNTYNENKVKKYEECLLGGVFFSNTFAAGWAILLKKSWAGMNFSTRGYGFGGGSC